MQVASSSSPKRRRGCAEDVGGIAVHMPGGPSPPDRALVLALLRCQTGPRKAIAQPQNGLPPQRTAGRQWAGGG